MGALDQNFRSLFGLFFLFEIFLILLAARIGLAALTGILIFILLATLLPALLLLAAHPLLAALLLSATGAALLWAIAALLSLTLLSGPIVLCHTVSLKWVELETAKIAPRPPFSIARPLWPQSCEPR